MGMEGGTTRICEESQTSDKEAEDATEILRVGKSLGGDEVTSEIIKDGEKTARKLTTKVYQLA